MGCLSKIGARHEGIHSPAPQVTRPLFATSDWSGSPPSNRKNSADLVWSRNFESSFISKRPEVPIAVGPATLQQFDRQRKIVHVQETSRCAVIVAKITLRLSSCATTNYRQLLLQRLVSKHQPTIRDVCLRKNKISDQNTHKTRTMDDGRASRHASPSKKQHAPY